MIKQNVNNDVEDLNHIINQMDLTYIEQNTKQQQKSILFKGQGAFAKVVRI